MRAPARSVTPAIVSMAMSMVAVVAAGGMPGSALADGVGVGAVLGAGLDDVGWGITVGGVTVGVTVGGAVASVGEGVAVGDAGVVTSGAASAAPPGSESGTVAPPVVATKVMRPTIKVARTPRREARAGTSLRMFRTASGDASARHHPQGVIRAQGSMRRTCGDSPTAWSSTMRRVRARSSTAPMTVPKRSRSEQTAVTVTKSAPVSQV